MPIDESAWRRLDGELRRWWDEDLVVNDEDFIRDRPNHLYLPKPFVSISPKGEGWFTTMFHFDTHFMNLAALEHGRLELVRDHILNYLFMIERFGFAPNIYLKGHVTRSHGPVFPDSIWRYFEVSGDRDILHQAYPLLVRQYTDFWRDENHESPIGLTTHYDSGHLDPEPYLSEELAAAAEATYDWMPIYDGNVRACVPLLTNSALVRYARVVALIAAELGDPDGAEEWNVEAERRAALIRQYNWNEERGLFLEYDFVRGIQLPYVSECGFWPLWAGVATPEQARRLAGNIGLLEKPFGVAVTDRAYPDPHPESVYEVSDGKVYGTVGDPLVPEEYAGGLEPLQWMWPTGWGTTQIMVCGGLDAYGYGEASRRIAEKYLGLLIDQFEKTGHLWEKYNVEDGLLWVPNSRYGNHPYHSFTAAAAVLLAARVFEDKPVARLLPPPAERDS